MAHSLGARSPHILQSFRPPSLPPRDGACHRRQQQWVGASRMPLGRSVALLAASPADARDDGSGEAAVAGGLQYDGVVEEGAPKERLDGWLARQLPRVSRARVQSSIRHGFAFVNGQLAKKASVSVKEGDHVECKVIKPNPFEAEPEDLALDVAYEDDHLLVINKPADMVVHPAPGHSSGTLVNALLYHCGLSSVRNTNGILSRKGLVDFQGREWEEDEEVEGQNDDDYGGTGESDDADCDDGKETGPESAHEILWSGPAPIIRPGIVHRLDKGTSGLLVVAKDAYTHEQLSNQFKARTVRRTYLALTCGLPPSSGRVDVPIGRDPRDRKRMAALPFASSHTKTRAAVSRYRVLEVLAQGGSAIVEWKLETGRTHQIRVHAQHLGYPILGDDLYGGTKGTAIAQLLPKCTSGKHGVLRHLVAQIERPCLHALTLGFTHPWTGEKHHFRCSPPEDFKSVLHVLRGCGS